MVQKIKRENVNSFLNCKYRGKHGSLKLVYTSKDKLEKIYECQDCGAYLYKGPDKKNNTVAYFTNNPVTKLKMIGHAKCRGIAL